MEGKKRKKGEEQFAHDAITEVAYVDLQFNHVTQKFCVQV
jgi:hypothetical protein